MALAVIEDGDLVLCEQFGLAASAIKQALYRARTSLIECVRFRLKVQG